MARKDRHTFLMGREADDSTLESLSRVIRDDSRQSDSHVRTSCDQYFSSTLMGGDRPPDGQGTLGVRASRRHDQGKPVRTETDSFVKGLILAQNERWRRGLGMQV